MELRKENGGKPKFTPVTGRDKFSAREDVLRIIPKEIREYGEKDDRLKAVVDGKKEAAKENGKSFPEINFNHVKNVIERLSLCPLSGSERVQIDDLSALVFFAERDGVSPELKRKINDGLSGLLKISAKYGA